MTKPPYFPLWVNNWLGSARIAAMTPAEEGAYFRLLCYEWQADDCTLPTDDDSLAQLSRLGDRWPASAGKIRACFDVVDGRLVNEKLLETWVEANEQRAKRSQAGKRGMLSRWHKPTNNNVITPLLRDNNPTPTPTPTHTEKENKQKKSAPRKRVTLSLPEWLRSSEGFSAELWESWMDTRRKKRATNTPHAIGLLLRKLEQRPSDAVEAIRLAVEAGWQDFEWEWFDSRKAGRRVLQISAGKDEFLRVKADVADRIWRAKENGDDLKRAIRNARNSYRDQTKYDGVDPVAAGVELALNNIRPDRWPDKKVKGEL